MSTCLTPWPRSSCEEDLFEAKAHKCVCVVEKLYNFVTISQVMQTAFICLLISHRELFLSPFKVRRMGFCNHSSGISDSRKYSSCFMFVSHLCPIDRQAFQSRHTRVSVKHLTQRSHVPLPLSHFNFLLTEPHWHVFCCFPLGCYQWAICVLLLGLASGLSALQHNQTPAL